MHARLDRGAVRLLTRTGLDWTRKYPAIAIASLPARQAYPRCFNSLDAPRDRFAVDSPLEREGFELSVPREGNYAHEMGHRYGMSLRRQGADSFQSWFRPCPWNMARRELI
jgi:hypothetical protein